MKIFALLVSLPPSTPIPRLAGIACQRFRGKRNSRFHSAIVCPQPTLGRNVFRGISSRFPSVGVQLFCLIVFDCFEREFRIFATYQWPLSWFDDFVLANFESRRDIDRPAQQMEQNQKRFQLEFQRFALNSRGCVQLTPPSSSWMLSTVSAAGRDTVTKYARGPNEFESDQKSAFANDLPRTS